MKKIRFLYSCFLLLFFCFSCSHICCMKKGHSKNKGKRRICISENKRSLLNEKPSFSQVIRKLKLRDIKLQVKQLDDAKHSIKMCIDPEHTKPIKRKALKRMVEVLSLMSKG